MAPDISDDAFDYVIVGGGTAGCVLAARLSEDASRSVLLLEAGGDERGLMMRVPAGVVALYRAGRQHWGYVSEPEIHAAGQALPYRMGRLLGGSSAINAMLWARGAAAVFDGWAALGCDGWSWREVEPLYRRIEHFGDPADPHMGRDGPIAVARGCAGASPLNAAFLEAASQAGLGWTDNCNGPRQEGACVLHRNVGGGERSDVYRGYLAPVRARPNLAVRCGAPAERLLVSRGRVAAVDIRIGGRLERVRALREVLLCAGALASPQLLMLSGIGDDAALARHGIEARHVLPGVGRNLHTHPTIRLAFDCLRPVSLLPWTRPPGSWLAGARWLLSRRGMAATNHMDVGCWLKTSPQLAFADAQITFVPLSLGSGYGHGEGHGFDIYMELVGVKSRGWLALRSPDPAQPPRFRFNFLEDRRDLAAFRRGARLMREIAGQPAFDGLRGRERSPGRAVTRDDDLGAWIARTVGISHHLAGSCRMGPPGDPDAVVGPDLKLHGLEGLRIADCSVMPFVTNGNTHAPAVMIGEKAADLVRAEAP